MSEQHAPDATSPELCRWCRKPMKDGGNEGFCWPAYKSCRRDFYKDLGDQSEWAGKWQVAT